MLMRWKQFFRLAVYTQLMPVLESGDDPLIGGQAVLEGVMMRAPHSYCVAVRKPDGEVVRERGAARRLSETSRLWSLPILRGLGMLGQAMSLGMKALNFSARHAIEEEDSEGSKKPAEVPGWMMALNIAFSLGFFIFLYKFIPLLATEQIQARVDWLDGQVGFALVDGVIRLALFIGFLFGISRLADIRRVFEYHGAEHKVVFNYESAKPVNVENAQSFGTFHPRCGTSFLMVVMLVSIGVYALIPFEGFAAKLLSRIALLPIIAGVSYEVIRFVARRQGGLLALAVAPGLWLQRITTKPPDDAQVEISIQALDGAMALEEEKGGDPIVA